MLCLSIDTTSNWCSVALVDAACVLAKRSENILRGHVEILAPMIDDLLKSTKIAPKDIGRISVCTGPGSFTGVRVGLSLAKGFALPWGIPIVGISALEMWAANVDPKACKRVLSAADVRRGQVFWQIFENGRAVKPQILSSAAELDAITVDAKTGGFFSGDPYICPALLAWVGMDAVLNTHRANPLYHRPPDAKLPDGKTL
ncbi:MAG: tRNA (adenosine(37)-N6)-threonylcarbamoyltransferase complex dimerization subunit type 1 TsaB [Robiginitomaculum sp.]